ncbi:DNA primase [Bovifimicola ammoniilytica]|mgnify:CR=1 FL=1|jgi:DNA primase|uniref:DNA primase n=1 Tax=Bovifimicola ammoniilytica TaxID=2981720 RepID=UPI00033A806F|nr:DNA primase [Bovifimicola ammoniilytica]MCU6753098.1 DNA primase [Bovifimicola ammoniilytica]CCZ05427.1 dNA primase [Eubacterium sp. CAG:603]SCJ54181.1 DNA primase [uncultured Eubacterium sp.]
MYYSDDLIEEIRSRNDIVDVISSYVKLKKQGATYFGLCPFHNEKSPSFSVTPGKQMYYCFGCGEGGNVYSFIMKYENYSFVEAVKMLADRAGITLPEAEYSEEERKRADLRANLLEINKKAAMYFHHQLKSEKGKIGLKYFNERGLDNETIVRFGLGYSTKTSNDLYQYMKTFGYSDDILKESGLFSFSEKGTYDKFWNRVMFPILDINSRVIGFGGRVMGEGEPKYLNSPETKIFEKSRNLYGMNFARISRKPYLLICEGYMDVIALHRAGFTNAVAALGTAFTDQHAMLIKRYVKEVVLTFDSDGAGRKAALRAIPILKRAGIAMKVLDMTPYKDPDEFIKNLGADEYQKRIDNAMNSFIFEIKMMREQYDLDDPHAKAEFYNNVANKLLEFPDELERNVYIEAVSKEFMIPFESLDKMVKKLALSYSGEGYTDRYNENEVNEEIERDLKKSKKHLEDGVKQAQKILLTWLIEDENIYGKIKDIISEKDFVEPLYYMVAKMLFEQLESGAINPAKILNQFTEEDEHREAAELFNTSLREEMSSQEKEKALNDTVYKVKKNSLDYASRNAKEVSELQEIINEQKKLQKIRIIL